MVLLNVFILFYLFIHLFAFETWSLFTTVVWEITATLFSCKTQAVFCELTFYQRECELIMTDMADFG